MSVPEKLELSQNVGCRASSRAREYRQAFPLLALLAKLLCQISDFEVEDKQ